MPIKNTKNEKSTTLNFKTWELLAGPSFKSFALLSSIALLTLSPITAHAGDASASGSLSSGAGGSASSSSGNVGGNSPSSSRASASGSLSSGASGTTGVNRNLNGTNANSSDRTTTSGTGPISPSTPSSPVVGNTVGGGVNTQTTSQDPNNGTSTDAATRAYINDNARLNATRPSTTSQVGGQGQGASPTVARSAGTSQPQSSTSTTR